MVGRGFYGSTCVFAGLFAHGVVFGILAVWIFGQFGGAA